MQNGCINTAGTQPFHGEAERIESMKNDAIGVFDSGMGGLTTVKELNQLLPHENIIYFGDTARVPYGSRSPETILRYAKEDVAFLRQYQVKMIIAACGTVSSIVGDQPFVTDIPLPVSFIRQSRQLVPSPKPNELESSAHRQPLKARAMREPFCSSIRISLLQRRRARCSFIWWKTVIPISTIL